MLTLKCELLKLYVVYSYYDIHCILITFNVFREFGTLMSQKKLQVYPIFSAKNVRIKQLTLTAHLSLKHSEDLTLDIQ